ncbi:MAG: hypothetical protein LC749_17395 [Actinobacteria bacterium]|nr:hypothetical protein [Actinomycetota bacterium]
MRRPRVRSADGTAEVAVPAYEVFTSTELLGAMALQLWPGVSAGAPSRSVRSLRGAGY